MPAIWIIVGLLVLVLAAVPVAAVLGILGYVLDELSMFGGRLRLDGRVNRWLRFRPHRFCRRLALRSRLGLLVGTFHLQLCGPASLENGIGRPTHVDLDGADGIVIAGDDVVDSIRVVVGVDGEVFTTDA